MSQRSLLTALCEPFVVCALTLACAAANAQSDTVSISYLEGQMLVAPDAVTTLGTDLFGDKVNLFNGSLEFVQTDAQLPGNNALAVTIVRRHVAGRNDGIRGQFGDWDLEAPRISGVFSYSYGWTVGTDGTRGRCSAFSLPRIVAAPPEGGGGIVRAVNFVANDYHQGVELTVPGVARQEVLLRAAGYTTAPTDGRDYPLVTREQWQISCLPSIQNGTGEGFLAVSPQGERYRFDWMSSRWQPELTKDSAVMVRREFSLHATEVTDRFGNWVRYTYDPSNPMFLTGVHSNDGRVITIDNVNGLAASVNDGSRTLTYQYKNGSLSAIELPDSSRWTFALAGLTSANMSDMGQGANCESPGTGPPDDLMGTMTHPSGATGRFKMSYAYHGRTYVDKVCRRASFWPNPPIGAIYPKLVISQTLTEKTITGPGLPTLTWSYRHGGPQGWNPCTGCGDRKTVLVTDPDGQSKVYEFGVRWRVNEGQLLSVYEGWTGTAWQRATHTRYRQAEGQRFPEQFGASLLRNSDYLATRNRPQDQRVINQQGAAFTWEAAPGADGFDHLARPLRAILSNSLGSSKTETTTYFDHAGKWVMGQVASVTDNWGSLQSSATYDPNTALPTTRYSFGLLKESYTYSADGTLFQRLDPLGRATTWFNYKRGIPQNITHRDSTQESGTVNNLGKLESHTNEAGITTYFGYDTMGRLNRVFYPGEVGLNYFQTEQAHEAVTTPEFGLAAGHWRQTTNTGNARTVRYYDALWRVRLIQTSDVRDEAGTAKVVEFRYDHDGHKTFESYPQRSLASVDTAVAGRFWLYDGLNRVMQVRQNSEVGDLTTTTEYLPGFLRRVTNPRGYASTFNFQAYDQPSEDHIAGVLSPDNNWLAIYRDIHGKPLSIVRGGTYAGVAQQATRSYFYDAQQRLCKTIEPETGATVQAYDGAGNLAWRASGLNQLSSSCYEAAMPEASLVRFGYDARDRLTLTAYGDGSPGIGRDYTPDGLPYQLWTGASAWTYAYNNRRLKTQETLYHAGQFYPFFWDVDAHGSVAGLNYPSGQSIQYAPDALGHPTQVSGFASNVRTHPNGAVSGYTLANGVVHTVTQNTRGLPELLTDAGVLNDRYLYDSNGNVSSITDVLEGLNSRTMGYDGLDRLTSATSLWGNGNYGYDALDNLRTSTVGNRSTVATLDAATQRLTQLSVNGQALNFGYDANGNLTQRGAQAFTFDIGNRLTSAPGKASAYAYDGHGRRAWVQYANGATKLQAYGQSGKLLLSVDSVSGSTNHIYLGDKLLAEVNSLGGNTTTTFSHTDALGSPVARTSSAGQLLSNSRTRYEAYGATAAGTNPTGIGFTGHVNDADTGLVYMQQRYYDPIAGRFLSVDPVTTNAKDGSFFGRYHYANNNPYKFVDPDGRAGALAACAAGPVGCAVGVAVTIAVGAKALSDTAKIVQSTSSNSSSSGSGQQGGDKAPSVPDKLVGTVDDKSGQQGGRVNNGPLAPDNGGTGDAAKDFGKLTGGKIGESGKYPGVRGENGIGMRPGKEGEGPRIDIPANGNKPAETLHYPKPEPK